MKKIFFLLFIAHYSLLIANCFAQQPTEEWVRRYSDTSTTFRAAYSIKADSFGNIYVLAEKNNDFGFIKYDQNGNLLTVASHWPGGYNNGKGEYFDVTSDGNVYITGYVNNNFNQWIYTVKYNTNGVLQWSKLYNYDNSDGSNDIKIDKDGNIVLVGGSSIGGNNYALIIKYSSSGDTLWTRHFNNGQSNAYFSKFMFDNSNNIYIAGNLSIPGVCLIMKYNSNGNQQWFTTFTNNPSRSYGGYGICLDGNSNLYVIGTESVPFSGWNDYLLKLNNSGTVIWGKVFTGILSGQGRTSIPAIGPVVSLDGNSIYFSTMVSNGMGGGSYSIATIKYDSNGDSQWVKVYGGGIPGANRVSNIKLDKQDNVYICGTGYYLTSGDDFVVIKYASTGTQQWVTTYTGLVTNGSDNATDLYIDTNYNVYVTGNSASSNNPGVAVTIKYSQLIGISINYNELPNQYKLYQNYPNPFNGSTVINYEIPKKSNVELKIYDMLGRLIKTLVKSEQNASYYSINLETGNLASGIYFYKISAGDITDTKKMILIK
ncbi:MAG: T9SS type A sorting domain-containing protein [Ignavibacteria bacterium]